jgi:hypothetical protein
MPRRRSMACTASARGKQSAFSQGLVAQWFTAHEIQRVSSTAKRLMR